MARAWIERNKARSEENKRSTRGPNRGATRAKRRKPAYDSDVEEHANIPPTRKCNRRRVPFNPLELGLGNTRVLVGLACKHSTHSDVTLPGCYLTLRVRSVFRIKNSFDVIHYVSPSTECHSILSAALLQDFHFVIDVVVEDAHVGDVGLYEVFHELPVLRVGQVGVACGGRQEREREGVGQLLPQRSLP